MDESGRKITKIAREAGKFTLKMMKEEGIGTAEFDFIHFIRHNPGVTQAKVREQLKIDKGAAARRAANLESKGYLYRKPNPEDGRSQLLYATEKAEQLKNSKASIESVFYEWLLAELPKEEKAAFRCTDHHDFGHWRIFKWKWDRCPLPHGIFRLFHRLSIKIDKINLSAFSVFRIVHDILVISSIRILRKPDPHRFTSLVCLID